eukprot:CAMPEP_0202958616 /NCGR_PEP_ID=MMETSP1396-20130829/2913_1 /ASSEMBLY_ACC=CAM_ASM_000872 /TAXON_ID= /ORGANISM="Pseudokeronopsis sp., Strain Brazil" /LENGTH=42 /DNA_ID= /DNA_START= /DNA_END= /DNA_ORIENTATION=
MSPLECESQPSQRADDENANHDGHDGHDGHGVRDGNDDHVRN